MPNNPPAEFPAAEKARLQESIVHFQASVDTAGRVSGFAVTRSYTTTAFAAAAEAAVKRWTFTPATEAGRAVPGIYSGQIDFVLAGNLPSARMYPGSSRDMWTVVNTLAHTAGLEIDTRDDGHQLLITKWIKVDDRARRTFGGLAGTNRQPRRIRLTMYVSPFVEPARVHLGSMVEVREQGPGGGDFRFYNVAELQQWFFGALDRMAGVGTPLPISAVHRRRLARSLVQTLGVDPCFEDDLRLNAGSGTRPLETVFKEQPIYPAAKYRSQGEMTFETRVLEDGVVVPISVVGPAPAEDLRRAAVGAMGLWRMVPLSIDGCAVPASMPMHASFRLVPK
ncbi:MAG TPA: TonB family protein [Vicinamibacterales bacterium]|nr:TonB family protein [Vicinamibacterales bacterium]